MSLCGKAPDLRRTSICTRWGEWDLISCQKRLAAHTQHLYCIIVYVCLYVCMHMYICIYVCTCASICKWYVYVFVCVYGMFNKCSHVYVYVYYIYVHMCVFVCICVCIGFGCCFNYICQIFILDITGYSILNSSSRGGCRVNVLGPRERKEGNKGMWMHTKKHRAKHKNQNIKSFVTCWVCWEMEMCELYTLQVILRFWVLEPIQFASPNSSF